MAEGLASLFAPGVLRGRISAGGHACEAQSYGKKIAADLLV